MGVEVDFDVSGALVTPAQPIPEAFLGLKDCLKNVLNDAERT